MTHATTILLVEDQADIRELFTLVLASVGYHVIAVAEVSAALDILATRTVDLLLTDYQMLDQSATELITTIRVLQPEVRIVLTSELSDIAARATSCHAHAWYRKGTPLADLVAIVAAALNSHALSRGDARCCV